MSVVIASKGPLPEVVKWLKKNQTMYEIEVFEREENEYAELPSEFIAASNRFQGYHNVTSYVDDPNAKKRKMDIDSTYTDLPRNLGGENLKNGRTKLGQDVVHMVDSTGLLGPSTAERLYLQFKEHGYLMFKGLLSKEAVMDARAVVLRTLRSLGLIDGEEDCVFRQGYTIDTQTGELISGKKDYQDLNGHESQWKQACGTPEVDSLKNSRALKQVLSYLSAGKQKAEQCRHAPKTFAPEYSWLRVKAPNEFTPCHSDIFYYKMYTEMFSNPAPSKIDESYCVRCKEGEDEDQTLICDECDACFHMSCLPDPLTELPRGEWFCPSCQERPILGTTWIPLGETPAEHGVLAVLPGTMHMPDFDRTLSANNAQISASYFKHAKGLTWHSGSFEAGDVVFFDSRLVHCTSRNKYDCFRISMDSRWCISPVGRKNFGETYHSKFIQNMSRDFSCEK